MCLENPQEYLKQSAGKRNVRHMFWGQWNTKDVLMWKEEV